MVPRQCWNCDLRRICTGYTMRKLGRCPVWAPWARGLRSSAGAALAEGKKKEEVYNANVSQS